MPADGDGVSAQLLLKISSDVSVLVTDVAVIKKQTEQISDHETRIRTLEAQGQQDRGGRDVLARVAGGLGILAAVGATVANFVHH